MALCKNSSHVITKVLRLTAGTLDPLLEKQDNLKVIQLFRNPFAIINSRTETSGYPVKDFNANAATLCKKMELDYQGAMRLKEKYPGKVKLVFYEDIKTDVNEKMEKLYEFIGMEYTAAEVDKLNRVKTNIGKKNTPNMLKNRSKDNAHWWRTQMSYQRYKSTYERCRSLMKTFNLTYFADRNHLMKLNIPDMTLPEHLVI